MSDFPNLAVWFKTAAKGDVSTLDHWVEKGLFGAPEQPDLSRLIDRVDYTNGKSTALCLAVEGYHESYARRLLGLSRCAPTPTSSGETPVGIAARTLRPDLLKALLMHGHSPNQSTLEGVGSQPLMRLIRVLKPGGHGLRRAPASSLSRALACIEVLLAHGANPAPEGEPTALFHAVESQSWPLVKFFLDKGVPADARPADPHAETPLHVASARWVEADATDPTSCTHQIIGLLMAAGANPYLTVKENQGPWVNALDICPLLSGKAHFLALISDRAARELEAASPPPAAPAGTLRL